MEGGLLEVRVSNKTDGDFQSFQESGRKSDYADGKSTTGSVYHPKFSPIRKARLEDINNPSWSISGRRSDCLIQLLSSSIDST